jgi:signal transduction histidine kinase
MSEQRDPEEVHGVIHRVNSFGSTTTRLFNRLYGNFRRRSELEARQAELQREIQKSKLIQERNERLKQLVEEREREIERLNAVLASISEGVILQDTEGRIVMINESAQELLGGRGNFWQTELGTLFDAYRDVQTLNTELVPLGEPRRIQVNNRILGANLAAVADSKGQRIGTIIMLRDVTKDALAERLTGSFVTHISHELKTPMAVIKMASEVLAGQDENQPANRRMLTLLTRNVDILNRMVLELLDMSEMSSGMLDIEREALSLEDVLWDTMNGLASEIEEYNLPITVMVRDSSQLRIEGDEHRLKWAIGHLVRNALYYNHKDGEIVISMGIDPQRQVFLRVMDTGAGISDKDLPHIFERFYRGEARTRDGKRLDPRGLGQGLFVARTVAEAHGGHISVKTKVGEGSVFTMALPAVNQLVSRSGHQGVR